MIAAMRLPGELLRVAGFRRSGPAGRPYARGGSGQRRVSARPVAPGQRGALAVRVEHIAQEAAARESQIPADLQE